MYHSLFIHPPTEGHLSCFQVLAIMNKAAINICVQVFKIYLFIYLCIYVCMYVWLHWVFIAARRLPLVVASGSYSSLWCAGFSLRWLLLMWSTGFRHTGSVVVACGLQSTGSVVVVHGLSCSAACAIFPDQGSNPCSLHWQAYS